MANRSAHETRRSASLLHDRHLALLRNPGSHWKTYRDETPIWGEAVFPARVPVRVLISLEPEYAVPVHSLRDNLSYFQGMSAPNSWTGHFRGSPTKEEQGDAQVIISAIEDAEQNPVHKEVDERKLNRKVPTYETKKGLVTVPDDADEEQDQEVIAETEHKVTHEEIQWLLLKLGAEMGLDLWVASNDRSKSFDGETFSDMSSLISELPTQFDQATNRIIELIDVLWLKKNAILAAFEIEHTTSIYSGLLRMSDLIAMQPNLDIKLYIVAPEERKEQVQRQINRPTFSQALTKPLVEICRFLSYPTLQDSIEKYGDILHRLPPELLEDISESMELEDV